jgi:hypothetical protein
MMNSCHFQEIDSVYQPDAGLQFVFPCTNFGAIKIPYPTTNLACSDSSLVVRRFAMTSKQRHDWQALCLKAVKEPDPKKQAAIVAELNRILQNQSKKAQAARANRAPRQKSA